MIAVVIDALVDLAPGAFEAIPTIGSFQPKDWTPIVRDLLDRNLY